MEKRNILNEVNDMRRQMGLSALNEDQLFELELNEINLDPLNEGWWENAKYALSKLGRYKAGGKILGKSQTTTIANNKIKDLLEKQGNDVIKKLDQSIREKNPEFPNNKKQLDFVNTIIEIATVYDSLVAATKLKPNEKGFLPVDAANVIINDLKEYTQKFLDVDLTAAFSVFNENEDIDANGDDWCKLEDVVEDRGFYSDLYKDDNGFRPRHMSDEDLCNYMNMMYKLDGNQIIKRHNDDELIQELNEVYDDLDQAKADAANRFAGSKSAIKKGEMTAYDSERMKTLNSNKLPALLSFSGGVLKGLSWLFQSDWFKNLVDPETIKTITKPEQITQMISGGKPDSQGMLHWMERISGRKMATGADVNWFIEHYGGEKNVAGMFVGNGAKDAAGNVISPEKQAELLHQLCTQNSSSKVGEIFTKAAKTFGSMKPGLALFGISMQATFLGKAIYTTYVTTKVAVHTGAYAKWGIAAKILGPLGIALMAGGLAVKLARWKGKKSSRAQLLNDLLNSLRPVGGTKENPPVIDNGGDDKNPKGDDKNPKGDDNQQGGNKQGRDSQLYVDLKKYFQDVFNFKAQTNMDTYGQGGSSNPTKQYSGGGKVSKKITQPNDVNDIFKLMESDMEMSTLLEGLDRLIEADNSLMKSINDKGQAAAQKNTNDKGINDVGLSSNQVKLFKTNINRLSNIIKVINRFGTQDKNLDNLLGQAKSNPLSTMDLNSLLTSDDKSLKIFISDFNKAIYSVQFKNGNNIMDQLKLININKLNEAAERVPGKGEMNKVYNDRREFIKNLPNYLKSMYAIFSFLLDRVKKGELSLNSGNPNPGGKNQTKGGNTNNGGKSGNNSGDNTSNDNQSNNSNNNQDGENNQGDTEDQENQNTGGGKPDKKGGNFYGSQFYNEGVELDNLINTHNNLIDIILENITALDEFGDNQPEMKQSREDAISNGQAGLIFQELATIIPELSSKIAANYAQKHNKKLNRVKLADFLSVVLGSLSKVPATKMVSIISRADMDVTAYKRMLKDVTSAEDDAKDDAANQSADAAKNKPGMEYNPGNPEKFLPNRVGNYDLSGINQAARIALVQKAAQIISRNNDLEQNTENVLEVMKQLIDDINKLGNDKKQIPVVKA